MVGSFDEDLVHGVHLVNASSQSPLVASGVKEVPTVNHNKRHASSDIGHSSMQTAEAGRSK